MFMRTAPAALPLSSRISSIADGKVDNGNLAVENLVAQSTHDFGAGIVLCGVHSLSGSAAAVGGDHRAVGSLVEFHAQIVEPLNRLGSFGNQLVEQLGLCGKVSAAERVEIVIAGESLGLSAA